MSSIEVTSENFSNFIERFKINLRVYDKACDKLEQDVDELEKDTQLKSKKYQTDFCSLNNFFFKEIQDLSKVDSFLIDQKIFAKYISIDLARFSVILNCTEESFLNMKECIKKVQSDFDSHLSNFNVKRDDSKPKAPNMHELMRFRRQTNNAFIFAVLQPGRSLLCIVCKKPIILYSSFLRHMDEYPAGSRTLKLHYYHTTMKCLIDRGFQKGYLSSAQVICEEEISGAVMGVLQDIGFLTENIRTKDDSDCESVTSDASSQRSGVPHTERMAPQFVYKRRDKSDNRKVFCVACQSEILTDSYIYRGQTPDQALHISKKCVQSDRMTSVDFSHVKCHVFNLLRNSDELKQLLDCGFYHNKLVGEIPQNPPVRGDSDGKETPPGQASFTHFVYRLRDTSSKQVVSCVGCKKGIFVAAYLTRGDTFAQPLHINKMCILADGSQPADFSRFHCRVFRLLKDNNELRKLLTSGFFYKNIIGYKPRKSEPDTASPPPPLKDTPPTVPVAKDVGYIFNGKPFICERCEQVEPCQGCLQGTRKEDLILRHMERIPRENVPKAPSLNQCYHARMDCLLSRGFTEKYLEFAPCQVALPASDNTQKVRDTLVRCGFSSENVTFVTAAEEKSRGAEFCLGFEKKRPESRIFVIVGTRDNAYCGGCGFKVSVNEACFLYRPDETQEASKVFHIHQSCLGTYFTKTELSAMICVNTNSMASVSAAQIASCGLASTEERAALGPGNLGEVAQVGRRANPLGLVGPKFLVDQMRDERSRCSGCLQPLALSSFVLRTARAGVAPLQMHLVPHCLLRCGFSPQQLATCHLFYQVDVSQNAVRYLQDCGFRNFPKR